ncbi:uncharacterized protein LOC130409484 [Triplophysa dalaica]|uniref:uncharacterized protein LOC130409484 n=1 Tax=Triplophysa dalaica TaxID=1582913 RepID=UPI0024DF9AC8|nr:uncharacterized protein LOC130409484 [Triplophysa dalaica]
MRVGQYVAVIFLLYIKVKGDVVNGSVTLKEGEQEAHLRNISKIKPDGRWTLEKNGSVVLRWCSPEEESRGCGNYSTSPRFSVLTVNDKYVIVLHNVTESDAGSYVFQFAGDKEEPFNVIVENSTPRTETESPNTSSTSEALAIRLSILAVVLLLLIYLMYKNKEKIKNWFKRVQETHCGMSANSSERDETSTDSVITIDNESPQNHQPLLPVM